MNLGNVVWTSIVAVGLSAGSILTSGANPSMSLALGLAAVSSAVLSIRE